MAGLDTVGGEDGHRIKHGRTGYSWGRGWTQDKTWQDWIQLGERMDRIKHGRTGYSWGRGWTQDKTWQDWIQLGERMDTG